MYPHLQAVRLIIRHLGGAIIHPSLPAIQLAEMASINNRVFRTIGSPLILPAHHTCMLKPVNGPDFLVTIDHLSLLHKDVKSRFNIVWQMKKSALPASAFPVLEKGA